MKLVEASTPFCAAVARANDEPMVATASKDGLFWVMLAYDGPWAPDAFEGSDLPEAVKDHLAGWVDGVERTRLVLVRGAAPAQTPYVIFASTVPGSRFVLRIDLASYDDLLSLSFPEIAKAGRHPRAVALDGPLMLVCTHGRKDRCCAKEGVAVFQRLVTEAPGQVLQTSHVGGHRFAAIVVTLPDGMSYGRVVPDEAPAIVAAARAGRIYDLAKLRGRAGLDEPQQAAEVFLRRELGLDFIDAVEVVAVDKSEAGARVTMVAQGQERSATVYREELPYTRPGSCGDEPTPAFAIRLRQID